MNIFVILMLLFFIMNIYKLIKGPEMYDRLIALNIISVQVILIIAFMSIEKELMYYMDIALLYSILSFAGIIVFTKYFKKSD